MEDPNEEIHHLEDESSYGYQTRFEYQHSLCFYQDINNFYENVLDPVFSGNSYQIVPHRTYYLRSRTKKVPHNRTKM